MMQTIFVEEGGQLALMDTYMAMILGSVDSNQYRKLFVEKACDCCEGNHEAVGDGDLACAFFVSSIQNTFDLISKGFHSTVRENLDDMMLSGWEISSQAKAGAIVLWGEKMGDDGRPHFHIGFCINEKEAVSNNAKFRTPKRHGIYELVDAGHNVREVLAFYTHPDLHSS